MSGNPFKLIKNKGIPKDDEMVEFAVANEAFLHALTAAENDPKKIKELSKTKIFENVRDKKGEFVLNADGSRKKKSMTLNTQKAIRWLSGIAQDADVNFLVESIVGAKKFVGEVATDFKKYFDESFDSREGARADQVAQVEAHEARIKERQDRRSMVAEANRRASDVAQAQADEEAEKIRKAQEQLQERQAVEASLTPVEEPFDLFATPEDTALAEILARSREQDLRAQETGLVESEPPTASEIQETRRTRQQQLSAEVDAQIETSQAQQEAQDFQAAQAQEVREMIARNVEGAQELSPQQEAQEEQDFQAAQAQSVQEAARLRIAQAQQLAAENNAQAQAPQGVREIVDEPRPQAPGALRDLPSSFNEAFESGDTVPDRITQLEQIFEQIKPHLNDPALKEDLRERIAVVRENLAEHKKKPLPIRIMKGVLAFGKEVLAFVAAGPLPVPLEVRAGAASLLAGIVGTEQLAAVVRGETTDLTPIRTAIEHGTGIPELAPVMDVASDVLDVADFGLQAREEFVRAQQGNSAVNSNPVPSHLTGTALVDTRAQQQMILNDGVIDSQGISVRVSEPVGAIEPLPGATIHTIDDEDFEPFEGEGERLGSISEGTDDGVNVPGGPGGPGGPSGPSGPGETVVLKGPEDILQITQGRDPNSTSYVNPIHLDAIGIYFKSSSNPKWDSNLLTDRNSRYANIDPESTRSYLLQQTRQLFNAYKFDLLIPKLLYDENSSIEDVIKENHEILQLWAKLKGISCLPPCEEEKPEKAEEPVESEHGQEIKEGTASSGHHQGGIVDPTRPIVSRAPEGKGIRHPKDKTMRFQPSNVSGIRIRQVVTDADIEANITPSLAEVVTAGGAPPLHTRSNMTRGFSHAGPVARGQIMDGIRASVISTQSYEPARAGYARTGKGLDQAHSSSRFNIRI